jgi:hypothetical protein
MATDNRPHIKAETILAPSGDMNSLVHTKTCARRYLKIFRARLAQGPHKTRPPPRKTPESALLTTPLGDKEWTPAQMHNSSDAYENACRLWLFPKRTQLQRRECRPTNRNSKKLDARARSRARHAQGLAQDMHKDMRKDYLNFDSVQHSSTGGQSDKKSYRLRNTTLVRT